MSQQGFLTAGIPAVRIVQEVRNLSNAFLTITTDIPLGDTIPQQTEGTEVITASITPTSATNNLLIEYSGPFSGSVTNIQGIALFQDATADAIFATFTGGDANTGYNPFVRYVITAGTTSSTTFKIRAGIGAGSLYINGRAGSRTYGGVSYIQLSIIEYTP